MSEAYPTKMVSEWGYECSIRVVEDTADGFIKVFLYSYFIMFIFSMHTGTLLQVIS